MVYIATMKIYFEVGILTNKLLVTWQGKVPWKQEIECGTWCCVGLRSESESFDFEICDLTIYRFNSDLSPDMILLIY